MVEMFSDTAFLRFAITSLFQDYHIGAPLAHVLVNNAAAKLAHLGPPQSVEGDFQTAPFCFFYRITEEQSMAGSLRIYLHKHNSMLQD